MRREDETQRDYEVRMSKHYKLMLRQEKNETIKEARKNQRKARKITAHNK